MHLGFQPTPIPNVSVAELQSTLLASPSLFPLRMNDAMDVVQFVKLDAVDYERASFLDERMLRPTMSVGTVPWNLIEPLRHLLAVRCDYIFHVSHCGSTLISRLLGLHPHCFALREPWLLRDAKQLLDGDRLITLLGLWSRVFRPPQKALIKATSFVNAFGSQLMDSSPESHALLIYIPATSFLAAVLDGSMSDIETQLEPRWRRLNHEWLQISGKPSDLSPGERCAMSWLAELLALEQLSLRYPKRTRWLDFEQFLNSPESTYCRVVEFFRYPSGVLTDAHHQLLHRYAKKTEVQYDSVFRSKLLAAAHQTHQEEIARGLDWLRRHTPNQLRHMLPR